MTCWRLSTHRHDMFHKELLPVLLPGAGHQVVIHLDYTPGGNLQEGGLWTPAPAPAPFCAPAPAPTLAPTLAFSCLSQITT